MSRRSRGAAGFLVFALGVATLGCGGAGGERGRREGLTGLGPDGGVCTKDEQTIKNVMLAPPSCNASNPCPCGTFCSSQTGGNCVADCVDDSWCAVGYKCSGFGQCLPAVDGGTADGGGTSTTDPSCPRDITLLNSLATMQRPCQFDDVCPQGSFCNHVKEICDVSCKVDSECASMNTPGHTFVCGCLGRCAEVAAPRVPPTTTLPTLEISPAQFIFSRPTTITAPNWGDTASRQITVVAVATFVTTAATGGAGGAAGAGGAGGAGGTTATIIGPTATIQANPGPGVMVGCPTGAASTGGTGGAPATSAMPCSFSIDPKTFKKVGDVYRSDPYVVTIAPSTAAGFAGAASWTLRLDSNDLAGMPRAVNLRYADAVVPSPTSAPVPVTTLDPNFFGVGQLDLITATGAVLHVAVKGRVWNGSLTFFDETRQVSPSGKLIVSVPANPLGWQSLLDATGDSDLPLQDTFSGGMIQRVTGTPAINQDGAGNLSGTFQRVTFTDFVFSQPATGPIPGTFDPALDTRFGLSKTTSAAVGACNTTADCTGGATCDLGFCSFGPAFHADPSNTTTPRGGAYQLLHKRMTTWGPYYGDNPTGQGHLGIYLPYSSVLSLADPIDEGVVFHGPLAQISGEPLANLMASDLSYQFSVLLNLTPLAVPLLTQHDNTWVQSASQLLHECVNELQRPRRQPRANPDAETFDTFTNCINLGRLELALNDKLTFQRALQGWLTVHSFVLREGLEETRIGDISAADELTSPAIDPNNPPPSLTQLLGIGESGLGFLIDVNANHGGAFAAMSAADIWNTADFRQGRVFQGCTNDAICNAGGPRQMACVSNQCQLLTLNELPQHEQPLGTPIFILETTTSYLKVLEAYLNQVARESYGQPADTNPTSARQSGIARFGLGMRLVLAVEQLAKGIHDKAGACPATSPSWNAGNCAIVNQRYNTAVQDMNVARQRVAQQGEALRLNANPFSIPEDDIPLFFGDPTGDNSRYFAASDYLIDGWASPAVNQASGSLDAARSAWISKMQSAVQDELNQHNRQQEIDQLMTKYGAPILANCGNLQAPGGQRLMDAVEVVPYYADGTRVLDNDNCFVDTSCVGPDGLDGREATNMLIESSFFDKANNQFILNRTFFNPGEAIGSLTVRSEVCKMTFWQYYANDAFQQQMKAVCPKDAYGSTSTAGPCKIFRDALDGHIYFWNGGAGSVTMPLAALYGPIRKSDIGTYYKDAPTPGSNILGITWATGPDDNVFNYVDYRTERRFPKDSSTIGSGTAIGDLFMTAAAQKCSDGASGRLPVDYPLPNRALLPASCFKGQLGVAYYDIATNNLALARAKGVLDGGQKGLDDTLALCQSIDTHTKTIASFTDNYNQLKHDYEVVSSIADSANKGISAGLASKNPYVGIVMGVFSLGVGGLGIAVQDEADRLAKMEKEFDRAEKSQTCWNSFRAQRRALATAMTDVQIASNQLNTQLIRFRNLQADNSQNLREGVAALQKENGSPVGGLAHSFWVDERVERFKKEFEWARKLTFVAMRAVEYEFQQSLPFRSDIVAAVAPSQLEDVIRGLKQEQAARTINRRRPEESSLVVSLRDDVLSIADRSADPPSERNWTAAQRFASRLWDPTFAIRDSKGNYLGQGVPFTLGPKDVLETRCGERLWRATATLQGDGIDASAPGASVLLLKRNTAASQYCAGKAPVTTAPDGTAIVPKMQVGIIHTSAQLFEPGSSVDLSDASQFTAALLYPWFNIRKTDFYKATYQDGASEELAGRGLYGDYVLLFPKQMLDDEFALDRVEDVLLRFDYLSVDNLSQ